MKSIMNIVREQFSLKSFAQTKEDFSPPSQARQTMKEDQIKSVWNDASFLSRNNFQLNYENFAMIPYVR